MDIVMKKDEAEVKAIAGRVLDEVKAGLLNARGIKGLSGARSMVPRVVEHVEKISKELRLCGEDKRAVAVQVICLLVPDRWVPDWLLEKILGFGIDLYCRARKKD